MQVFNMFPDELDGVEEMIHECQAQADLCMGIDEEVGGVGWVGECVCVWVGVSGSVWEWEWVSVNVGECGCGWVGVSLGVGVVSVSGCGYVDVTMHIPSVSRFIHGSPCRL